MRLLSRRAASLAVAGMFVVGACSSTPAATTAPTTAPATSAPATTAPSEAPPSSDEMPGTKEFTVAFTSTGLSSAPFLAAIKALNDSGYTIKTEVIAESELVTQGVASGDFAFGSGANNALLAAVEKGANLKALMARVKNEWTLYARTDIADCAGLAGKRLAIHSEGAVSTAMVRNYINEICPGTEPLYVTIEGSNNRVTAMLADQIDASPLELSDAINIDATAGDRYHQIASFANDLPDLQTTSIYVNGPFATENPGSVLALVKAVLDQHKQIEGNAAYLKGLAEEFVPDAINPDTIDAAAAKYVELGMFPADGGTTDANMDYTSEFFGPDGTGATDAKVPVIQFTDLHFLELALAG